VVGLEFIVIGTQKAGTTTLWQLLRDHPELWLPETKEAPFFSHSEVYERGLSDYLQRLGAPAAAGRLRGTVTPHYMHGWRDTPTRTVAERIARDLPEVRLVALLREPIARARSQHAMALARGRERRGVDRAMSELLRARLLNQSRMRPDDTNSYVVQGEYGRILGEYLEFFPRARLHVEYSEGLAREPVETVRRILRFLGVREDYTPAEPFRRDFAGGGRARVSADELRELLAGIDSASPRASPAVAADWLGRRKIDARGREELQRLLRRYAQAPPESHSRERKGLEFALTKIWNVAPAAPEAISEGVRERLAAHFAGDAAALGAVTGSPAPWVAPG
jgi:Sulfotransferase domain